MKTKLAAVLTVLLAAVSAVGAYASGQPAPTSNATVEFTAKETTPPVDPENPTEPQEPEESTPTGQSGNLTLDVVPFINFGSHAVPTLNVTINALIQAGSSGTATAAAQPFIQVSDARASAASWTVQVEADSFVNNSDNGNVISGAKLSFAKGAVKGPVTDATPDAVAAVVNCITGPGDEHYQALIFSADEGKGSGTWVNRLYPTPWGDPAVPEVGEENPFISLYIPANSGIIGDAAYTCVLTWTLTSAP